MDTSPCIGWPSGWRHRLHTMPDADAILCVPHSTSVRLAHCSLATSDVLDKAANTFIFSHLTSSQLYPVITQEDCTIKMTGGGLYSWAHEWFPTPDGIPHRPHHHSHTRDGTHTSARSRPHPEWSPTTSQSRSSRERHSNTPSDSSSRRDSRGKHKASHHTKTPHRQGEKSRSSSSEPSWFPRLIPSRSRAGPTTSKEPERRMHHHAAAPDLSPGHMTPPPSARRSSRKVSAGSSTLVNESEAAEGETGVFEPPNREPSQPPLARIDSDFKFTWRWSADLEHLCKHSQMHNPSRHMPFVDVHTAGLLEEVSTGYRFAFATDFSVPDVILAFSGSVGPGWESYCGRLLIGNFDVLITTIESGPREGEEISSRLLPVDASSSIAARRQAHHAKVMEQLRLSDAYATISEKCGTWLVRQNKLEGEPTSSDMRKADKLIFRNICNSARSALDEHELSLTGQGPDESRLNQGQINLLGSLETGEGWRDIVRDARLIWNRMETKMGDRAVSPAVAPPSDLSGSPSGVP